MPPSRPPPAGRGVSGVSSSIGDVDELVDTLNSSLDVIKDALRQPATPDSADFVNNLMLEVQQNRDKLQACAEELVESGQFGSTDRIFEALEQVSQVEPRFDNWTRSIAQQQQGNRGSGRDIDGQQQRRSSRGGQSSSTGRDAAAGDPFANIPSFGFGEETERLNPEDEDDEDDDDEDDMVVDNNNGRVTSNNTDNNNNTIPPLALPGVAGRSRQSSSRQRESDDADRRRSSRRGGGGRDRRSHSRSRRSHSRGRKSKSSKNHRTPPPPQRPQQQQPSSSTASIHLPEPIGDTALPSPPPDAPRVNNNKDTVAANNDDNMLGFDGWDAIPIQQQQQEPTSSSSTPPTGQGPKATADAVAAWDAAFADVNDNDVFQTIPDLTQPFATSTTTAPKGPSPSATVPPANSIIRDSSNVTKGVDNIKGAGVSRVVSAASSSCASGRMRINIGWDNGVSSMFGCDKKSAKASLESLFIDAVSKSLNIDPSRVKVKKVVL